MRLFLSLSLFVVAVRIVVVRGLVLETDMEAPIAKNVIGPACVR